MADFVRMIRQNWDSALAISLASAAIALNLGPGWVFLGIFLGGCAYIINIALRD